LTDDLLNQSSFLIKTKTFWWLSISGMDLPEASLNTVSIYKIGWNKIEWTRGRLNAK